MNVDQIAKPLLDVVKIFLFSFMSYSIIDSGYSFSYRSTEKMLPFTFARLSYRSAITVL